MKGKQIWLLEDEDLTNMYSHFHHKKDIILWCHVRKNDESPSTSTSAICNVENKNKTNTRSIHCMIP